MTTAAETAALFKPLLPGLLGIEFTEVSKERVAATMKVRADLCTTNGILHGGSIMAFADTLGAVGTSMNLTPGSGTTTVESSTKFLAAALEGTTVTGRVHAVSPRPHDDGVADTGEIRSRQTLRRRDTNPTGAGWPMIAAAPPTPHVRRQ